MERICVRGEGILAYELIMNRDLFRRENVHIVESVSLPSQSGGAQVNSLEVLLGRRLRYVGVSEVPRRVDTVLVGPLGVAVCPGQDGVERLDEVEDRERHQRAVVRDHRPGADHLAEAHTCGRAFGEGRVASFKAILAEDFACVSRGNRKSRLLASFSCLEK